MTLSISLLGSPSAERDGETIVDVRGQKAWVLLAYLLLSDAPVPRARLSGALFPDAADPSGTLRWNLSQLRRHLCLQLDGDPVRVGLPDGTRVDVLALADGDARELAALPQVGQDLLAGIEVTDSPVLQAWLDGERRHVRALTTDVLREAATEWLAGGRPLEAVQIAEQVVALEPLDENANVLLVRCLAEAGRTEAARRAAETAAGRLRDELGVDPTSALWSAVHASASGSRRVGGRVSVEAQLETGEAAIAAGVVDAGIDALRGAVGGARALDDPELLSRSLTALGSALIHGVRGVDQDALALLHEAIPPAEESGRTDLAAFAERELGYVEFLRARYERADRWFSRAGERVQDDDAGLSWVLTFAGAGHTDVADYPRARTTLDEAVLRSERAGDAQAHAMARAMRGRLRLLQDDLTGAAGDLECSLALADDVGWRSFQPWPETLLAEVDRQAGDLSLARNRLEHAYAVSCQVGDPCWESMALRGLGLIHAREGHLDEALDLLEDAPRQCRRLPDTYLWIEVYGLDALAEVAVNRCLPNAASRVEQLDDVSTRLGMRDLSLRSASYRVRLGQAGADDLLRSRSALLDASYAGQPPR